MQSLLCANDTCEKTCLEFNDGVQMTWDQSIDAVYIDLLMSTNGMCREMSDLLMCVE